MLSRTAPILLSLAVCLGCASLAVPVRPPQAFLYEHIKAPIDTNADSTRLGTKVGESRTRMIRDFILTGQGISWGDASVEAAARAGRISDVRHVDYELLSVLGIYVEFTTIVYGE